MPLVLTLVAQGVGAQTAPEPEACILDTLKSSGAKDATAMIRFNCVRQYIKSMEGQEIPLPLEDFQNATAKWNAPIQAFPSGIPERMEITLKNDSQLRVIEADVTVVNKTTKKQITYKAYATYPIDPGTVGTLDFQSITDPTDDFWKVYTWGLVHVYGVAH